MEINPLDSRLSNFDMKLFQNIEKPSEAKKNINDNFYFLWNSFLQRLSKMITKSLPQQSFFYIISIEKRRKRFGMKMKMKIEMNSIVDFWYCSNFERSCHKTGMFVDASEENADMDTWKIHSFNTIPFPFPFPSKYSLVGCHGDGGTVSRNNVRTTIFQLLRNRRKWRKIPTNNFIRYHSYSILTLFCMLMSAPSRTSSSDTATWPFWDA